MSADKNNHTNNINQTNQSSQTNQISHVHNINTSDTPGNTSTSDRPLTIHDVARELEVSASTVSRAISGKGRIGDTTRERVLKYIEETGFHPNASAQSLAQARTNNIAVILPEVKTLEEIPFFHTCMYGVGEMAQSREYDIIVVITSGKNVAPLERLIMNRKVDGMILTRTYKNDYFVQYLKEMGIPLVTIGRTVEKGVIQVDHDNAGACRGLTESLFEQGMQQIAYLGSNLDQMVNLDRYEGYRAACKEAGQKGKMQLVYTDLNGRMEVEKAVEVLLSGDADCLLCQDDLICDVVLDKLTKMGTTAQKQVKVASCHYSRVLEHYPVAVASLKFDTMNLGRKACQILLDSINGVKVPMRSLLDYEIVMENSPGDFWGFC